MKNLKRLGFCGVIALPSLAAAQSVGSFLTSEQVEEAQSITTFAQKSSFKQSQSQTGPSDSALPVSIHCANPIADGGWRIDVDHEASGFLAWVSECNFGGCMPIGTPGLLRQIKTEISHLHEKGIDKLNIRSKETDTSLNFELDITLYFPEPKSDHGGKREAYFPGELKTIQGKIARGDDRDLRCAVTFPDPKNGETAIKTTR